MAEAATCDGQLADVYAFVPRDHLERFRRLEELHIDEVPEGEREEIRQIFAGKGFSGDILEQIVQVITRDRKRWVDTMLIEEWGLQLDGPIPWRCGLTTFAAFVLAGLVPLAPLVASAQLGAAQTFQFSAVATGVTFFGIGMARGRLTKHSMWLSGIETLLVGGVAATLAYLVGAWLKGLVAAF